MLQLLGWLAYGLAWMILGMFLEAMLASNVRDWPQRLWWRIRDWYRWRRHLSDEWRQRKT